jgi:hypothetical protein
MSQQVDQLPALPSLHRLDRLTCTTQQPSVDCAVVSTFGAKPG